MNLTPKEQERLTVFMAAELARRRRERGVRLNHPEAVAYISDWCVERARDGWDVAEIRAEASQLLDPEDVMPGVPEMVDMIQVEPVFPDGTKLVTVHDPIRSSDAMDPSSDHEADDSTEAGDAAGSESVADGGRVSGSDEEGGDA